MIRKHKKYAKPKKAYDKARIEEENKLVEKYGLKSKREIWKTQAKVSKIRNQAKRLITESLEKQKILVEKLQNLGFDVKNIPDVLSLNVEDMLKRRLQSILLKKKVAKTAKEARQLIVHKHILVNNSVINKPSYLVPIDEENKIGLKIKGNIKNG